MRHGIFWHVFDSVRMNSIPTCSESPALSQDNFELNATISQVHDIAKTYSKTRLIRSLIGPKARVAGQNEPVDAEQVLIIDSPAQKSASFLALYFCEVDELGEAITLSGDHETNDDHVDEDGNDDDEDFVRILKRRYQQQLKSLGMQIILVPKPTALDDEQEDDEDNDDEEEDVDNVNEYANRVDDNPKDEVAMLKEYCKSIPWPCVLVGNESFHKEPETSHAQLNGADKINMNALLTLSNKFTANTTKPSRSKWKASCRLFNRFRITTTPALVLIDVETGEIVCRDCLSSIRDDPSCERFPWAARDLGVSLSSGNNAFLTNKLNKPPLRWSQAITKRYVGLLFSAGWCNTERHCIDLVSKAYTRLNTKIDYDCDGLDVVFVTLGGHDEVSFHELYHRHMPLSWLAVDPQEQQLVIRDWQVRFGITEYPSLIILDCEHPGQSNPEITILNSNALGMLECETTPGELFPWLIPTVRRFNTSTPAAILDGLGEPNGAEEETVLFLFTDNETNARAAETFAFEMLRRWRSVTEDRLEGAQYITIYVGDMETPFVKQLRKKLTVTDLDNQEGSIAGTDAGGQLSRRYPVKPFASAVIDFASETFVLLEADFLNQLLDTQLLRTLVEAWLDGELESSAIREVGPEQGNCPGGHGLRILRTPTANYRCDVCGDSQPEATEMFSCRTCNYDECLGCHERIIRESAEVDGLEGDDVNITMPLQTE